MNLFTDEAFQYDSHVHFFGTGLGAVEYLIDKNSTELSIPSHLLDEPLIKGFGWSDKITHESFIKLCTENPEKFFCLSYIDGHTSFVSKNLIDHYKFKIEEGGKVGEIGFIVSENERDQLYALLPRYSFKELELMALKAQEIFQKEEIQKLRHLTGNFDHWTCLKGLEKSKDLKLKIEVFFSEFIGQSLGAALESFKEALNHSSDQVSAGGIKIFYDGSFGSNTAFTSLSTSAPAKVSKALLLDKMSAVLIKHKHPLAVHTIGDQALEDVLGLYSELQKRNGPLPTLHLEHAPIFSQISLQFLKKDKLNCVFHFQPSHWIEDHKWYSKNHSRLEPHEIYPFEFLKEHEYLFHLGSDSPVVAPTKANTLKGLKLIEESKKTAD